MRLALLLCVVAWIVPCLAWPCCGVIAGMLVSNVIALVLRQPLPY